MNLLTEKVIGRPKSANPKNRKVTLRMTENEFQKLEEVARKKGLSKSETILKGIELLATEK